MKRLREFAYWVGFMVLVLPTICTKVAKGQTPFPVMLVDTSVRNRLAGEWDATDPFQSERGYCIWYAEAIRPSIWGPIVVYTLTGITRAGELGATPRGIARIRCPDDGPLVFLHTHPPGECADAEGHGCVLGGKASSQCFPSPADMRSLNRGDKPFALIQCDGQALVPFWRTEPLPLFVIPPFAHR